MVRADAIALIAERVAFEALGFFFIEENLTASPRVSRPRQRYLDEFFVFSLGALAAEVQMKLDGAARRAGLDQKAIRTFVQHRREAIRIDLKCPCGGSAVNRFAVQPDFEPAAA